MSRKDEMNENAVKDVEVESSGRTPFANKLEFEASEAYNVLRTNLILSLPSLDRGRVIGVTSSFPHEGKSYTTVNLAYALAKNGDRTLLINADMRKPTMENYYKIPLSPGLSNLLTGKTGNFDIMSLCHNLTDRNENLYVMAAGDIPPNPSELLGSRTMTAVLEFLTTEFDYILIDLPPVTTVVDPIAVSQNLDGMLLVVRHAYTKKRMLNQAMRQLRFANVRVLGFVYNGYSKHSAGYYRRKNKKSDKEYSSGDKYYSDYYKR